MRQWNIANNAKYIKSLADNTIPAEIETLTEENRLNEYIMTALRTAWGLDLDKLNSIAAGASSTVLKISEPYLEDGSLLQNGNVLTLTPHGKLYADNIAAALFF